MASRTIRSVEDIKKRARQVRERGRRAARRLADKDIDALTSDEAGKALGQATAEWVEASDKIRELMGVGSVPLETGQEPPSLRVTATISAALSLPDAQTSRPPPVSSSHSGHRSLSVPVCSA